MANSGVISALDGDASQYVRGDGTLADFPTSTGGGSSVSYYLNTSVSQGTIGGVAYKQLSKVPISGAGTDVTISANGYIASYITDANDPALLEVPAGNFNCEFYFSVNSNSHNPYVYAELYKYDGSTFTLLGSNQAIPEYLTNGTTLSAYYFAIPVATAALTITDRLSIRIFVNVDGRTVTLHTENNHLCQVVTTFSKGLTTLNSLTRQVQFFQTGTSGSDFNISSVTATHTFNIPDASASARGLITTGIQTIAGNKTFSGLNTFSGTSLILAPSTGDAGILNIKRGAFAGGINDYTSITSQADDLSIVSLTSSTNRSVKFDFSSITSGILRTYTLPNDSGTIALTSGLTGFVPYTGATASVNLGAFGLTTTGIFNNAGMTMAHSGVTYSGSGQSAINGIANGLNVNIDALYSYNLLFPTANNNYTFPNASGTIALLSATQVFTGSNTFSGLNQFTFSSGTAMVYGPYLTKGAVPTVFSGSTTNIYSDVTTNNIVIRDTSSNAKLLFDNSTQTYTFPAASGTVALTSDLGSYLPLAGGIMTGSILLNNNLAISGQLFGTSSYASMISMSPSNKVLIDNGSQGVIFGGTIGQGAYTYNLPTASGTLALTSQLTSGTVTSVAALTLGTSGTDLSSSVANSTTTPVITLNVPTASATNRGALSSADWTTFNNKASTADLANYLLLTGGTLTGQLYINPTNTATVGLDVASNTTSFRSDNLEGFKRQLLLTMSSGTLIQFRAAGYGGTYVTDMSFVTSSASGINSTPALYLTGGNKVGILTGTPAYTLDIVGTLGVSSTSYFAGSVGIGISSPTTTFDVIGTSKFTATASSFNGTVQSVLISAGANAALTINGSTSSFAYQTFAQNGVAKFEFGIDGTTSNFYISNTPQTGITNANLTINKSTGYIGVATSTPSKTLDIVGTLGVSGATTLTTLGVSGITTFNSTINITAGTNVNFGTTDTGALFLRSNNINNVTLFSSGNTGIYAGGSDTGERFQVNGTARFNNLTYILANLGIGTVSPTVISGFTSVCANNATTGAFFEAQQGGTVLTRFGGQSDITFIDTVANIPFIIKTNSTERLRVTNTGRVGIGRTAPGTALSVAGQSEQWQLALSTDTGAGAVIGSPSANVLAFGDWSGTERMRISSTGVVTINGIGTGAVTATAGVLSATSDMNLKISDGYIDTALDKILKLTPRYFYWKEETGLPTNLRQLGFYAQEVNEAIGEEGANTPKNENDKWGIYDRAIIAMLTKGMQEQQSEIQELKSQIQLLLNK